tara:strand:+ start:401 stop:727 length:327 start_codon:yes stop_codon:yes gene_type:complete
VAVILVVLVVETLVLEQLHRHIIIHKLITVLLMYLVLLDKHIHLQINKVIQEDLLIQHTIQDIMLVELAVAALEVLVVQVVLFLVPKKLQVLQMVEMAHQTQHFQVLD